MSPHQPLSLALQELDLRRAPGEDDLSLAWRLAVEWANRTHADSYEKAALRRLALALAAGDAAGIERAALWIVSPAEAMERELARRAAEQVLDREVAA